MNVADRSRYNISRRLYSMAPGAACDEAGSSLNPGVSIWRPTTEAKAQAQGRRRPLQAGPAQGEEVKPEVCSGGVEESG
jgi:hypothetical protein